MDPEWIVRWNSPYAKWWKRRLSKSRRRFSKELCNYMIEKRDRYPKIDTRIESLCNWKNT